MSVEDSPRDGEEETPQIVRENSLDDYLEAAERVKGGVMSGNLFKQHETHDEHPVPPGSMKEKVLLFLTHWRFEVFIVILIVGDLVVTLVEMGLEYRLICITGELVPIGRDQIKGLAAQHEALFTSYDSQPESSNTSLAYFSLWPDLQKEAAKGAMMLQIGAGSLAKLMDGPAQPEDIAEGHGVEGESAPHGASTEGGHGHAHHKGTLICEGKHGEKRHRLHFYCHVLGLSILAVFIMELALKAWANLAQFLRSKLQVLDLIIVTTSFTLDFVWPIFESRHPELLETRSDLVKVIILFIRLIRVVKVMHASSEILHKGLHYVKELKEKIVKKNEEIEKLKEALKVAQGGESKKKT